MLSWFPQNVSTYGVDIDAVFEFIYYIVGVWFIATQIFLLYCLIRYRRREGKRSAYAPGATLSQAMWILIPCALVLAIDLWIDIRGTDVWAKVKLERPKTSIVVPLTATHPSIITVAIRSLGAG